MPGTHIIINLTNLWHQKNKNSLVVLAKKNFKNNLHCEPTSHPNSKDQLWLLWEKLPTDMSFFY